MSTTVLHYAMHALFAFEYLPGLLESIVIEDDEEEEDKMEAAEEVVEDSCSALGDREAERPREEEAPRLRLLVLLRLLLFFSKPVCEQIGKKKQKFLKRRS